VLHPVLYTPTSLPMMPRPGTQALVVSRADKIVISALFASSLVGNNVISKLEQNTVTTKDLISRIRESELAEIPVLVTANQIFFTFPLDHNVVT